MKALQTAATLALIAGLGFATGCKSHHVDVTVENRSGALLQLVEVDYPSASFGTNSMIPDAVLHYRVQLRGSGPVSAQYSLGGGKTVQANGPSLNEGQDGQLKIVLESQGKIDFKPQLAP